MHKACLVAGCPRPAVFRGRCMAHARERERVTHPPERRAVYNARRWEWVRRRQLNAEPICEVEGCDEYATDVDHIVPIKAGGPPYARENLRSLCGPHHSQKTRHEQTGDDAA